METHCIRCKRKTPNVNEYYELSANDKPMIKSECSECGCKRVRFISNKAASGAGLFTRDKNKVKLPGEKHLPGGYNWCGPGTKVNERLNLMKKKGISKPINEIDDACFAHDLSYNVLRRVANQGDVSENELLQLTQQVDDELIRGVKKAKTGSNLTKAAMIAAFRAKKRKENLTGKPLFVYGSQRKDATTAQLQEHGFLNGSGLNPEDRELLEYALEHGSDEEVYAVIEELGLLGP